MNKVMNNLNIIKKSIHPKLYVSLARLIIINDIETIKDICEATLDGDPDNVLLDWFYSTLPGQPQSEVLQF